MLVISKNSIWLEYFEDGALHRIEIDHDINTMTKYMDHTVQIEPDVTVGDIFRHLSMEADLINTVFDSSLGGYDIRPYLDEAVLPPDQVDDNLKFAVFEHHAHLIDDFMSADVRLSAIGGHPSDPSVDATYTLELSAINSYAHLPVIINDTYQVWTQIEDNSDEVCVFGCQKLMTMYDIISALLYEVSYHGTPEQRRAVLDEVRQMLEHQVESQQVDSSSTPSTEDLVRELESKLVESLAVEDYETSAQLRDKINELKNKKVK